ncbi:hypothetical protein ACHAXS_003235 [Conticribra weissflogii]
MSSVAAQRKAWNEAMRNAGAVIPSTTPNATGGPFSGGVGGGSRLSDRRRKASRRDKARKSSIYGDGDGGGGRVASDRFSEEREYRVAIHMDMLEGVNDNAISIADENEDEEYDEFAELDENDDEENGGRSKSKRKRKRKPPSSSAGVAGGGGGNATALPKYLKPRSLASILIEEASRSDSVAKQYVDAAVRPLRKKTHTSTLSEEGNSSVTTITKPYPARKFCPVTGLFGEYTDPKSGIPYATLPALEQIRERAPPWMSQSYGGSASYWEAIRSLKGDE